MAWWVGAVVCLPHFVLYQFLTLVFFCRVDGLTLRLVGEFALDCPAFSAFETLHKALHKGCHWVAVKRFLFSGVSHRPRSFLTMRVQHIYSLSPIRGSRVGGTADAWRRFFTPGWW